jgi:ABC-type nitrate/sulfonate/bicarbonate transport system substrate-binding protein
VRDDAGNWTFADPKGKTLAGEAPQAWSGNILTWLQEWADEHGLDIGSDTNEPLWDGTRPDYDMAVGALLAG